MKLLALVILGCFIAHGSTQRVPIGGSGSDDSFIPSGEGSNTLSDTATFYRRERDLSGDILNRHIRTRRSPQRFFFRPFGGSFGSFFRPQVNRPFNIVGPGGTQFPGAPPANVVGPGGTQFPGPPPANVVGPGGTRFPVGSSQG